jgi:hypothetical protein
MPVKLNSSGGGSVTLDVPSTASTFTATIPANTGTVVTTGSTAAVTPAMLTQPLTLATVQNSTSGTFVDFTDIPSWVRRITVMYRGVSTNGTSNYLLRIGSGSILTSGYVSNAMASRHTSTAVGAASTAGFIVTADNVSAAYLYSGHTILTLISGNIWVSSGILNESTAVRSSVSSGDVSLGGALDLVRLTTVNGTDTFDAGSVNIMYEG